MERIGIIGLGRMGSAMAARFAAQGVTVTGWTRSGRAVEGVLQAPDLVALALASDTMILSLFDDAAVVEVLDTLLTFDIRGRLIVETSTVVPMLLTDRAAAFAAAGAAVVDAPVSGGPDMVLAGTCGIFIGGATDAAARAQAVLAALSGRIFHVGPLGTGLVMKTINNAMMQSYTTALTDMLRLAKRAGLPLEMALGILCGGPAAMPMIRDRLPKILGQDTEVGFPMSGILKDNDVFRRVAHAFGVETPGLALAAERYRAAIAEGFGDADPAALIAAAYHDA
jgi:3-hydroxyisobutyrate dehydrogenase-like beta-hydroxyacid dehydrogenase